MFAMIGDGSGRVCGCLRQMGGRRMSAVVLVILFLGLLQTSECQLDANSPLADVIGSNNTVSDIWAKASAVLYTMVNSFLGVIGSGKILTQVLEYGYPGYNDNTTYAQLKANFNSAGVSQHTKDIVNSLLGYIICTAIGLAFVIFMCSGSCCFKKLRKTILCGKVGEKKVQPGDKLKINILMLTLVAVTIILTCGLIFAIISGAALVSSFYKQAVQVGNYSGSVPPIVSSLLSPAFTTIQMLLGAPGNVLNNFNTTQLIGNLNSSLSNLPGYVTKGIERTNCPTCGSSQNFSQKSDEIQTSLITMQNSTLILQSLQSVLNQSLDNLKRNILANITGCTTTACGNLRSNVSLLIIGPKDYYQLPNLTDTYESFAAMKNSSIGDNNILSKALSFLGVTNLLNPVFGALNDIDQKLTTAKDGLSKTILPTLQTVSKYANLSSTEPLFGSSISISTIVGYLDLIGKFCVVALSLIGLIFLPTILLNVVGLTGSAVKRFTGKTTEKIFILSAKISFAIGSVVMVLVTLLFLLGGVLYSDCCQDLLKEEDSHYFKLIDQIIGTEGLQRADEFINSQINGTDAFKGIDFEVDLEKLKLLTGIIFDTCKHSRSIFSVLFEVIDLDRIADSFLEQHLFKNDLLNISQFSTFKNLLPSPDSFVELNKTTSLLTDTSNGAKFISSALFNLALTTPSLEAILRLIIEANISTQNTPTSTALTELANLLRNINDTTVLNITNEEQVYLTASNAFNKAVAGESNTTSFADDVKGYVSQLKNLNSTLNQNTTNFFNDVSTSIKTLIKNQIHQVIGTLKSQVDTIVPCYPIYKEVGKILKLVCNLGLDPLNGFWFSFGWCTIMFVPSILIGLWLGGLLVRQPPPRKSKPKKRPVPEKGRKKPLPPSELSPKRDSNQLPMPPVYPGPPTQPSLPGPPRGNTLPPYQISDQFPPPPVYPGPPKAERLPGPPKQPALPGPPRQAPRSASPGASSRASSPGASSRASSPGASSRASSPGASSRASSPGASSRASSPGASSRASSPGASSRASSPGASSRASSPGASSRASYPGATPRASSPGASPRTASSGAKPRVGTSGTKPRVGTPGTKPRVGTPGTKPRVGTPGTKPRVGSAGAKPPRVGSPGASRAKRQVGSPKGKPRSSSRVAARGATEGTAAATRTTEPRVTATRYAPMGEPEWTSATNHSRLNLGRTDPSTFSYGFNTQPAVQGVYYYVNKIMDQPRGQQRPMMSSNSTPSNATSTSARPPMENYPFAGNSIHRRAYYGPFFYPGKKSY